MSTPDRPPGPTVVTVERMVAGGDGLARLADGRVAFVSGGLPDEVVELEIIDDRGDFVRGRVSRVVGPSPDRRSAPCAHRRTGCGGCGWMELDDSAQSSAKVDIVREALRRTARLDPSEVDRLVSFGGSVGPFGWRTTVRVVGTGDGIGFRRAGSSEVVPIDSCPVAHEHLDSALRTMSVSSGTEATVRCSVATGVVTVAP
ncbi:MAG: TRAM domain-containing protein, partial [Actinomycetota bacterium]